VFSPYRTCRPAFARPTPAWKTPGRVRPDPGSVPLVAYRSESESFLSESAPQAYLFASDLALLSTRKRCQVYSRAEPTPPPAMSTYRAFANAYTTDSDCREGAHGCPFNGALSPVQLDPDCRWDSGLSWNLGR
jgi:hypothetical protein